MGDKRSLACACLTHCFSFYRIAQCYLESFSCIHAENWTFMHVLTSATLQLLQATSTAMRSYPGNNETWQREMRSKLDQR